MTVLTITVDEIPDVETRCRLKASLATVYRAITGTDADVGVDIVPSR
jgi:hypothetical protein